MVRQAQRNGLITGLAANLFSHRVVILQYADDTIICLKENIDAARNLKPLLYIYKLMSGLKINFAKSEVLLINGDDDLNVQYADFFSCQTGSFPIKYMGVYVSPTRLHTRDWLPLVEKNEKQIGHLEGKISFHCWQNHTYKF